MIDDKHEPGPNDHDTDALAPHHPRGELIVPSWDEAEVAVDAIHNARDHQKLVECYLNIRRAFTTEEMKERGFAPEIMLGLCLYAWHELLPSHGAPVTLAQLAEQCCQGSWAYSARLFVVREDPGPSWQCFRIRPDTEAAAWFRIQIVSRTLIDVSWLG